MVQSSSSSSSATPTGPYVSLHVSAVSRNDDGYLITLTITDASGMPEELFVFRRRSDGAGGELDEFSHVASPSDIAEYPADVPQRYSAHYRLATASLVFRDLSLLVQSLSDTKRDICLLVESEAANLVLREDILEIT